MRSRQNTWASSTFRPNSTMNSVGSSRSISHHPMVRRSTYPLADAYSHPLVPSSSSATLLATGSTSNTSPFFYLAGRPATISSATTTTQQSTPPAMFLSRISIPMTPQLSLRPIRAPPAFHAQSLLFMFGFLFFPCWWIGAFYLGDTCTVKEEHVNKSCSYRRHHHPYRGRSCHCRRCRQTSAVTAVDPVAFHPSMLANGRPTSSVFAIHPLAICAFGDEGEKHEQSEEVGAAAWEERERAMFRQWNRWMSFASVGLVGFIIAMLVWYHVEVR